MQKNIRKKVSNANASSSINDRSFLLRIIFLGMVVTFFLLFSSCSNTSTEVAVNSSRYMDRVIYLSDPNIDDPGRNNFFQKEKVKEAITEMAISTGLGDNYFSFVQVPESELESNTVINNSPTSNKSFILIWPDSVFNNFAETQYGSVIPDMNAITVVNAANKKQFYIIVRASCAETSPVCNNISTGGFKALIARQFGLLVGLDFTCTNPLNTMCSTPSDSQWDEINKFNYSQSFKVQLDNIDSTVDFYK